MKSMTSTLLRLLQAVQAKAKTGYTLGMLLAMLGFVLMALVIPSQPLSAVNGDSSASENLPGETRSNSLQARTPAAGQEAAEASNTVSEPPPRTPSSRDSTIFVERLETVLPTYAPLFMESAAEYGQDWRLLAAIGYQESKWDAQAVSPTGVRGLMMLTQITARQVEIENREDPAESILGAARYLTWLDKQLPKSIHPEDRLWFTLAAYNVGMGHVLDARVLTERNQHDPNRWLDVRKHLPLLSKEEWHSTVRHGFARGSEPVAFVDKVRHYKQLLSKHVDEELLVQIIANQTSDNLPG